MEADWDALRDHFGFSGDCPYELGDWFVVPEASVFRSKSGNHFAREKARLNRVGRRVVLAGGSGPNVNGFARSTKQGGFGHSAHRQPHGAKRCCIDRYGWVVLSVPVTVDRDAISCSSYSCSEPEGSRLLEKIKRRMRP